MTQSSAQSWALILGASSGFGGSTAKQLARMGMHVAGVHLDRRQTMPLVEQIKADIEAEGVEVLFFNVNAADPAKRAEVLDALQEREASVRVMLHSLAFGALRDFIAGDGSQPITQAQLDMTLDVMAHSLVYWTQDLVARGMMAEGGRIYAMTSSGSTRVIRGYGAVSAAKAALESHVRQLAFELMPKGITVNGVRAGVTDTPAMRKIPGSDQILEQARQRNPGGRLTTPDDVAQAIAALCVPGTSWLTGNVIGVDGGEDITG
ncbi:MAG: SDR family oxidoreductase [Chloroflexota bacterium]|nr:SDR family oxidoreductase [Chloroflexota bacterium]